MEEENFGKKSSKKALKITLLIVLILAIAGAIVYFAFFFNKTKAKPEDATKDVVGQMFEGAEKLKDIKTAKIELDISGSIKASGNSEQATQINMVNGILKSAKLHTDLAYDSENKVFDGEINVKYQGKDVITAEAIMQNEKLYGYLKDLYSKYIEIPLDEFEIDISEFESMLKSSKVDEQMVKDIEEIIKAKIDNTEVKTEEETIEISGKNTKVNKATLRLSVEDVADILVDVLDKVNEYQTDRDIKQGISSLKEELKDVEDIENYIDIVMYTEKSENALVKLDVDMVNEESDEIIVIRAQKEDKTWEITFGMNENSTNANNATDILRMEITEENENEGKISVTAIAEEEGIEITVNVEYKVEYNVAVEKKDVKNSIKLEEMTEADLQEILENAEKNEFLKSIIDMGMNTFNSLSSTIPGYSY